MSYGTRITYQRLPLEKIAIMAITLLAFALRVWQLGSVPPGWRDDELINVLVISQKVLDGDWQVYYADASGNEALYHALNAAMYALFGANFLGIRLLSAFFGVTAVPLTWLLGRKLFGSTVGLLAAAALALSFWSLMYSRFGLRQIVTPTLMLLAFYFFWRALAGRQRQPITDHGTRNTDYTIAAICTALGFYAYFAGRGVPLILLAFCVYLALTARPLLRRQWPGILLLCGLTAVLALPLAFTLQRQPEAEGRVSELAGPLIAAGDGDFSLIQKHLLTTLSMFHADGDDEWLYNIPHRPLFTPIGAISLWLGVAIAAYYATLPLWRIAHNLRTRQPPSNTMPPHGSGITDHGSRITDHGSRLTAPHFPAAFLLLWWLAGLSPGFISVPPASLGHTILAQPATFLLMALPVQKIGQWLMKRRAAAPLPAYLLTIFLSLTLLSTIAGRDLPDYFVKWPQASMVRFLYRADLAQMADYLNRQPGISDFAVAGMLDGPWDRLALESDLAPGTAVSARWYHLERAIFLRPSLNFTGVPDVPAAYAHLLEPVAEQTQVGHYTLAQARPNLIDTIGAICFQNGLCSVQATYKGETGALELAWLAARPLDLPPFQLISNPPPPDVYAGPRLLVFAHLLDAGGNLIAGDDGLWVDPYGLQAGDIFLQQHRPAVPGGETAAAIVFGLYDPMTGERILTNDGRDHIMQKIGD